jgi:glucan phosphoethanolaminetransferase (alkaline phosphatase superfamily)
VFSRLDILPQPFVILVLVSVGLSVFVGMGWVGRMGDTLVHAMSLKTLVALQIFRLPLELLMLRAAYLGIMPIEFSMRGYNLDVLTGAGAVLILTYCAYTRILPLRTIWLWNVLGIVCLLVIAVLAALTSPNLHAFGRDAQHINSWVLYFPYSMLPTLLVTYAAFGHVLLSRKLLTQKNLVLRKPSSAQAAKNPW